MPSLLRTLLLFCCLLYSLAGRAQTTQGIIEPEPVGGTVDLALVYYKINFTQEQRQYLTEKSIELIFPISAEGKAKLEKINGVTDPVILDSLVQASARVPRFRPKEVNGVKQAAVYFYPLRYPAYGGTRPISRFDEMYRYHTAKLEDLEHVHLSGKRLEIVFGFMANSFYGKAAEYLEAGGGMKVELQYVGKKGIGSGLIMDFYGNNLKKPYPIASTREQNSGPPTLLVGMGLNKALVRKERKELFVQAELALAFHNVTPRQGDTDEEYTQFIGGGPGLVAHYLLQVGKSKPSASYGTPALSKHYVNLHAGLRSLYYSQREASGLMVEAGISYRFGTHMVDSYQWKQKP
ncbi:hypothetical protein [Rufibacter tibetensis]|nr:hypothetical protein [Rufibacter tibetensis]